MLIVALVLAVVSLAALVAAVVTGNDVIAWVCIGFSALGVVLLIVDAVRDRSSRSAISAEDEAAGDQAAEDDADEDDADEDEADKDDADEDYPVEVISDQPDADLPSDDEPVYPLAAEEAAMHIQDDTGDSPESDAVAPEDLPVSAETAESDQSS